MPIKCQMLDRMSGTSPLSDADETMPINLRFDKALPYYVPTNGDSGFASSPISRESSFSSTEQDTAALSRNSSFSSSSAGSTIDTDSSVSRSSSRRSNEDDSLKEQRRRLRAARVMYKNTRCTFQDDSTNAEVPRVRPSLLAQGRSSSAGSETQPISSKSRLSAPDALIISTPPGRSFMQYRSRSRSWNYDSNGDADTAPKTTGSERKTEERNKTGSKECLPSPQRGCDVPKRTQGTARGAEKQLQHVEALRKERDELRRERDRFRCERDAIELERDALLREKEELEKELENRSSIIRHMKEHMKTIPVAGEESRSKMKHRSKSEVKRPAFFPEETNAVNTNAYTCL